MPRAFLSSLRFRSFSTPKRRKCVLTHLALPALLVATYFLYQTWRGVFVDFHHDDIMNLYYGWREPWSRLFLAIVFPFDTIGRPFGNLLYVAEFAVFGFNTLAFRIIAYLILISDIALVYQVARLLFRSRQSAFLAALIFCFHPQMLSLLVNNGTIYDVLGTFWVMLAAKAYLGDRLRYGFIRLSTVGWLVVCWIAGTGTKEFVAMLPFCLLGIEAVLWRGQREIRNTTTFNYTILILGVMCLLSAASIKAKTREGAFLTGDSYNAELNARRFGQNLRREVPELFGFAEGRTNSFRAVSLHLLPVLAALLFRDRRFLVPFVFIVGCSIPMWAIPWRGLFVYQVALAWWAIFAAELIIRTFERLFDARTLKLRYTVGTLLLWGIAGHLLIYRRVPEKDFAGPHYGNREIRGDLEDYGRLGLRLPKGGAILLLDDRSGPETWTPALILQLLYQDDDLTVHRVKKGQQDPTVDYDAVLDLKDGHLTLVGGRLALNQKEAPGRIATP